jgi:hypothetical protein
VRVEDDEPASTNAKVDTEIDTVGSAEIYGMDSTLDPASKPAAPMNTSGLINDIVCRRIITFTERNCFKISALGGRKSRPLLCEINRTLSMIPVSSHTARSVKVAAIE